MTDTFVFCFHRPAGESPADFGKRLRAMAADLARRPEASTVILHVDDGGVGAPPQAGGDNRQFDATLTVAGLPTELILGATASYRVGRRVMKRGGRLGGGQRTEGFVVVSPVKRAAWLSHDEFDRHWRENHGPIHVRWSPGTRHYEQLIIHEALPPEAARWDAFGWLGFATPADYIECLSDAPEGAKAIGDDVLRFLDPSWHNLPASEYVYRDGMD